MAPDPGAVDTFLSELQGQICRALETEDGAARFEGETLSDPAGTRAMPRVLDGGPLIEKAAVNFTHARGARLPAPATARARSGVSVTTHSSTSFRRSRRAR